MRWWMLWCLSVGSVVAAPDLSTCSGGSRVAGNIARLAGGGKRVKQVHPDWIQTEVYHLLYLPKDWQPGKRYPVIVEYAGNGPYQNRFGDIVRVTRKEQDGLWHYWRPRFIWVCIPYLNTDGTPECYAMVGRQTEA